MLKAKCSEFKLQFVHKFKRSAEFVVLGGAYFTKNLFAALAVWQIEI